MKTDQVFTYRWPAVLKKFMPKTQQAAVREILKSSEEPESYAKSVLDPLTEQIKGIPKLYATEKQGLDQKLIHAHFFYGDSDWYIAEYDASKENRAFGYTILNGDRQMAEWGYISIDELSAIKGVELDFYWEPKTLPQILGKAEAPAKPKGQPVKSSAKDELTAAIESLRIAEEFSQGKAKAELKNAIEALELALEFT